MSDLDGAFGAPRQSADPCWQPSKTTGGERCGGKVTVRLWDSNCGGYTDHKYSCDKCGLTWWCEGADA